MGWSWRWGRSSRSYESSSSAGRVRLTAMWSSVYSGRPSSANVDGEPDDALRHVRYVFLGDEVALFRRDLLQFDAIRQPELDPVTGEYERWVSSRIKAVSSTANAGV